VLSVYAAFPIYKTSIENCYNNHYNLYIDWLAFRENAMIACLLLQIKALFEDAGILDEKAQTLVEYGLILMLIAVAVVLAVTALGGQVNILYERVVAAWP